MATDREEAMATKESWRVLRRKVISNKAEIRLVVPFQLVAGVGLIFGFIVIGAIEHLVPKRNGVQKKLTA
jgi:hypothetical protein